MRRLVALALPGPAANAEEQERRERLIVWCQRYGPLTAADGEDGVLIDITGCAHLFGGEPELLADLCERLERAGFAVRAAIAARPAVAWALARYVPLRIAPAIPVVPAHNGPGKSHDSPAPCQTPHDASPYGAIVPSGAELAALAPLPVDALRLPTQSVSALHRVGLRRIADLLALPRSDLRLRFGAEVITRLDQAIGGEAEAVFAPLPPDLPHEHLRFPEPVTDLGAVTTGLGRLLVRVCQALERSGAGGRRFTLALYTPAPAAGGGTVTRLTIGTARPLRCPQTLARLFVDRLEQLDHAGTGRPAGYSAGSRTASRTGGSHLANGVDALTLTVENAEPFAPTQGRLPDPPGAFITSPLATAPRERPVADGDRSPPSKPPERSLSGLPVVPTPAPAPVMGPALAGLFERLGNRLGAAAVLRPEPQESWEPERAVGWRPILAAPSPPAPPSWPADRPRPLYLLASLEPIEVESADDDRPTGFRRRQRYHPLVQALGPERLALEWWHDAAGADHDTYAWRDYYRVEDSEGGRYWLFRAAPTAAGGPARWFLHGLFA